MAVFRSWKAARPELAWRYGARSWRHAPSLTACVDMMDAVCRTLVSGDAQDSVRDASGGPHRARPTAPTQSRGGACPLPAGGGEPEERTEPFHRPGPQPRPLSRASLHTPAPEPEERTEPFRRPGPHPHPLSRASPTPAPNGRGAPPPNPKTGREARWHVVFGREGRGGGGRRKGSVCLLRLLRLPTREGASPSPTLG